MLGSLAGRESTSKSNDHRWPLGQAGGDFVQPDEERFIPPLKWSIRDPRCSLDNPRSGVRANWQLSHNLFVAEINLGDDSNYGPSPLGQRRL
jgi:hypothetical protein